MLNEYIKKNKTNRCEFAKKLGISKVHLDRVCWGTRRPSPELALKIALATGWEIDPIELLYPEEHERVRHLILKIEKEKDMENFSNAHSKQKESRLNHR